MKSIIKKAPILLVTGPGTWDNLTEQQRNACLTIFNHHAVIQHFTVVGFARARATCHQWYNNLKLNDTTLRFNLRVLKSPLFEKTIGTIQTYIDCTSNQALLHINQLFVNEITYPDSVLGKKLLRNCAAFLNSTEEEDQQTRERLIKTLTCLSKYHNPLPSSLTRLPLIAFVNHADQKENMQALGIPDWNERIQSLENSHVTAFKATFELEDRAESSTKPSTLVCRFFLAFALMLFVFSYISSMLPKGPDKIYFSFQGAKL